MKEFLYTFLLHYSYSKREQQRRGDYLSWAQFRGFKPRGTYDAESLTAFNKRFLFFTLFYNHYGLFILILLSFTTFFDLILPTDQFMFLTSISFICFFSLS